MLERPPGALTTLRTRWPHGESPTENTRQRQNGVELFVSLLARREEVLLHLVQVCAALYERLRDDEWRIAVSRQEGLPRICKGFIVRGQQLAQ